MNCLLFRSASLAVVLAAWLASPSLAIAGDAIILPQDLKKTSPSLDETPSARGSIRPTDRIPSANPNNIEGLVLPSRPGPRRMTERERRARDERDERNNWLLLRPGQLTDRYDERKSGFGVSNDDFMKSDKELDTEARDYMFWGVKEKEGEEGESREGAAERAAANQRRSASETDRSADGENRGTQKRGASTQNAASGRPSQEQGAHTSEVLDIKGYFNPDKETLGGQPDTRSLKGFLSASATPTRTREQEARMEEFKQFLESPKGGASGSGLGHSIRLPGQLARPSSAPASGLPESPLRSSGGDFPSSRTDLQMPTASRGPLAPSASSWNTPRTARSSSGNLSSLPSYSSSGQQPITRPSVMRPTVLEIPQRKM